MINWQDVITTLGGQAVFLAVAAWLAKTVISHRLSKEADSFKAELKADAEMEVERLKNLLQLTAIEHQVRFSGLHAKRAEVITDLYRLLSEARTAAAQFIFINNRDPEEAKNARAKVFELYRFIDFNEIYLPPSVCQHLRAFEEKVRKSVVFVDVYWRVPEYAANQQTVEQQNKVMLEACQALESEIPALRKQLVDDFRALLGVDNTSVSR